MRGRETGGEGLERKNRNKAHHKVRCYVEETPYIIGLLPSPSDVNEERTEERGPWAPGRTEIEGPGLPWRGQHVQQ